MAGLHLFECCKVAATISKIRKVADTYKNAQSCTMWFISMETFTSF